MLLTGLRLGALLLAASLALPALSREEPAAPPPVPHHKHYALSSQPGGSESELLITDTDSSQLLRRLPLGRGAYKLVAYPPAGRIYVLTRGDFTDIWVVDTRSDRIVSQLSAVPTANDLALSADGKRLYVAGNQLQVVATESGAELGLLPLPAGVVQLAAIQTAQDGQSMLVKPVYKNPTAAGQTPWMVLVPEDKGQKGSFAPLTGPPPAAAEDPAAHPNPWYIGRSGTAADLVGLLAPPSYSNGRYLLVASKNRNYLLVADPSRGEAVEAIPMDAGVDQLVVSQDRKRAYAYQRGLSQISYLHLEPNKPTTYSIFRRVQLPSFNTPGLALSEQANRVYLWDGRQTAVAAVDIFGTKVQPVLRPETLEVRLFRPIHHIIGSWRNNLIYYLRDGLAYAEDTMPVGGHPPRTWPVKVEGRVASVALTSDERFLYAALPSRNVVAVVDAVTLRTVVEIPVGKNPQEVVISPESDLAFVLNVGDTSITTIDTVTREVERTWSLGQMSAPRPVRSLDETTHALIQVHMPVYTDDDSLQIAPLP